MAESPEERSAHAQLAALSRSAREPSGAAMTARARETFLNKFYDATDPALPEVERHRQADAARRAHFVRLARASVRARRAVREAASELASLHEGLTDAASHLAQ